VLDDNFNKFWVSFKAWHRCDLPDSSMLKDEYVQEGYEYVAAQYGNGFDSISYRYVNVDYDSLYQKEYGVEWIDLFDSDNTSVAAFKPFIELLYDVCVKTDERYRFTIAINERLRKFKIPYKLQSGKLKSEGYKSTEKIQKIVNYEMCERKIRFSEEMIMSQDFLDKKAALDYIVDSLQYLISVALGERVRDKYKALALTISEDENNKIYSVVKTELDELMKIANEFFDIRHNEYLNKAKEMRESLNDKMFIEYLYNRVYALTYLIRLKYTVKPKQEVQNG